MGSGVRIPQRPHFTSVNTFITGIFKLAIPARVKSVAVSIRRATSIFDPEQLATSILHCCTSQHIFLPLHSMLFHADELNPGQGGERRFASKVGHPDDMTIC